MGPPRFFAPDAAAAGATIELPGDEAAQLTRVLRLRAGDRVHVFNGRGGEWAATVDQAGKEHARVTLGDPIAPVSEPRIAMTLAVAVLKGDKMDDVVRDSVMLGAAAIQPLVTTRTEISAASLARSGRTARWQRIAVSSAKQCGRAVVPEVHPAVDLPTALTLVTPAIMLVEPAAARSGGVRDLPAAECAVLLIGPEGGWTSDELTLAAAAGAMLVTLGRQTLRADAVPIVALTALRVRWDDL